MIHMPNTYNDEDWNDLSDEEREQSLRMSESCHSLSDETRAELYAELKELEKDMGQETDIDALRDLEREYHDIEEMLRAEERDQ